jgi:DNA replication protein DnaC
VLPQILDALALLGLGEMHKALEQALADPQRDESRMAWLWRLVEPQVRLRLERRAERRIRAAKLKVRKTFAAFDFNFQPKLDKDFILQLATLRFVDQGKNVLLAGMSGTGKSHVAQALALLACTANRRVCYTTSADMLARLNASLADHTLAKALRPYVRAELLVLDEVGLEQVERREANRSGLMQKVLLPRYNDKRATIITSNIPWEAWGEYLDDHLGATALLDRMIHHSHVIVINGPSYRDWVHQQDVAGRHPDPPAATPETKTAIPTSRAAPAVSGGYGPCVRWTSWCGRCARMARSRRGCRAWPWRRPWPRRCWPAWRPTS